MLRNKSEQISFIVRIVDVIIAALAFIAAYAVRQFDLGIGHYHMNNIDRVLWLLGLSIVLHFFIYENFKFYTSLRLKSVWQLCSMVVKSFAVEFVLLGSFVFLLQQKETSRLFFGLYLAFNYSLLLFVRVGVKSLLSLIRKRGYNYRRILIVGTGTHAARVTSMFLSHPHWGYIISDKIDDNLYSSGELASVIAEKIKELSIDEVYFAVEKFDATRLQGALAACESMGIPAVFSMDFFTGGSKAGFVELGRLPMVAFYNTTVMTLFQSIMKRTLDVVVALVGLILGVILLPWIALMIWRQSPGPLIYKGKRIGENGRVFSCYKFRTMRVGADLEKQTLAAQNQLNGPIFKIENDPRVFPFGAFLRRTSLDELPQFFNVLRGDMSVVGTRPPTPDEVEKYQDRYRRRLSIRPGITGLWQVSGRNQIRDFEDVLRLDLHYIDHWSLWLDVKIIVRTVWVVFSGRGAG